MTFTDNDGDEYGEHNPHPDSKPDYMHIAQAKKEAKRLNIPFQFLTHEPVPEHIMNDPSAYNWDGTPKSKFQRPANEAGSGKFDLSKYRKK